MQAKQANKQKRLAKDLYQTKLSFKTQTAKLFSLHITKLCKMGFL